MAEIEIKTAPADFRFPTTNQTRHCFTRYIEFHRCVVAKADESGACDKFAKYYRSLCPGEWIEKWNEQRENVIQGAGGMQMIDPLYQRMLVRECKNGKIPVIFHEVFTGFRRLGRESTAEMLCCQPDISCFAKLMAGGIIPLAATLTSDAVFEAFTGDSKLLALLHGHSYSAHAMGRMAAVESLKWSRTITRT